MSREENENVEGLFKILYIVFNQNLCIKNSLNKNFLYE